MAAREIIVKKYVVRLSGEEREQLAALTRKGRGPAQRLMKARILLKADASEAGEGWSDNQIIEALETSASMVYRVRKQLVEEGLEAVLSSQATSGACRSQNLRWREGSQADCLGLFRTSQGPRTLDIAVVGKQGRGAEHRRSRQRQHNRADPQKNILKPHLKQQWVIPPKANSAFVAAMEDVLAVYTRPRDPDMPLVCLDETSKQLIAETRSGPDEKGAASEVRLRIRAQRHGQSLHDVRTARRLAACQSHGSPHRRGLCSCLKGFSRYPLLQRQENCSGARQSQHPYQGFAL